MKIISNILSLIGKAPKVLDPERVLALINPPEKILSLEHIEQLIRSKKCYSLVEKSFFDKLPDLFSDLAQTAAKGDILQAGVWKGGSGLYLQALNRHFQLNRSLWLSDTFSGFVKDQIAHEKDQAALAIFSTMLAPAFPVPADVKRLFQRAGLWDKQVFILPGALEQTLPESAIQSLCLVHIDVDFYEPTYAALALTYPKLEVGGYVIIDDYGVPAFNCKDAVDKYRSEHGITEPIHMISDFIAYWKKERHV